ncbi:MAG: tRNA uridine(34) 5-carboxymethylaminomethyl modification radical SAM/GNAT enzyme Elp3 [Candidatus Diapherotrites archaeon]|nr:tRNA uridine(34) 5-carboxymethylaminomethyl modification radical SAM/GNAT enzyme Elp3 [Candidatus Diapherotrites archaeon]
MASKILSKVRAFAEKIILDIDSGLIFDESSLSERKFFWSGSLGLEEMPSHSFILAQSKNPSKVIRSLLSIKPTRSISGVQVVAVMLPPFPCPGKCIYCPTSFEGKSSPKSYTGYEPSSLRAQRLGFDPYKIVSNRVTQLDLTGNRAEKIELIFQGSSFTTLSKSKQELLVKKSLDGVIGKKTVSFARAKILAEASKRRVVGITFETRPDLCAKSEIKELLSLGGTRVELGVQNPDNLIYKKINRGHTVKDVVDSTALLKDSAFKVLYHLMPGLPGSKYKKDLKNFKMIFSDERFKPDMVKFYPCLVIKGTKLFDLWEKNKFEPIDEAHASKMLVEIKSSLPKWVRVMRVNRDIPSTIISGGIKKTNLRQLVEEELHKQGKKCKCIRCREIGIVSRSNPNIDLNAKLGVEFYDASKGEEAFISAESKDALFGFARLRNPAFPFLPQIKPNTALLRELHVYGRALSLGVHDASKTQHQGLGKELMLEAERIAKERFDSKKMVVISGLGVKEYYIKNFGYKKDGPYVSKEL